MTILAIVAAVTMLGCAPQANDQQGDDANLELRGMIASDQQSIEALKEQLSQEQDEIDELRHSGAGAGGKVSKRQYAVIDDRLTKLETAVSALQGGQPPAGGAPAAAMPPPGGTPMGANPPGAPVAPVPGAPPTGEIATPPPPSDEAPPPGADSAPPAGTNSNPPASGDSASAGGTDSADSGAGADSGAPPPAAMPEVGSDWHSALDQQLVSAGSNSDDPATPLYMKGLQDMKAGNYDSAVGHFGALMRRYPKSDLTEPAEYFSANALYETGKYEQSILQFNDLVIRSPDGRYASAALLREAQAFVKINDRIDARLTLQKLLADHSGSTEASAANSMLKDLQSD